MSNDEIIHDKILNTLEEIALDNIDGRATCNRKINAVAVALVLVLDELKEIREIIGAKENESN